MFRNIVLLVDEPVDSLIDEVVDTLSVIIYLRTGTIVEPFRRADLKVGKADRNIFRILLLLYNSVRVKLN